MHVPRVTSSAAAAAGFLLAIAPLAHATSPTGDVAATGVEYRITLTVPKNVGSVALDALTPVRFTAPDGTTGTITLRSLARNWSAAGLAAKVEGGFASGRTRGAVTIEAPKVRGGMVRFGLELGPRSRSTAKAPLSGTVTVKSTSAYAACPTDYPSQMNYTGTCQGSAYASNAVRDTGTGQTYSTKAVFCLVSGVNNLGTLDYAKDQGTDTRVSLPMCGTSSFTTTYGSSMRSCMTSSGSSGREGQDPLAGPTCSTAAVFRVTISRA